LEIKETNSQHAIDSRGGVHRLITSRIRGAMVSQISTSGTPYSPQQQPRCGKEHWAVRLTHAMDVPIDGMLSPNRPINPHRPIIASIYSDSFYLKFAA